MQFEKEMSREEGISDKGNPRKMGRIPSSNVAKRTIKILVGYKLRKQEHLVV